jgi:hypothetical protein
MQKLTLLLIFQSFLTFAQKGNISFVHDKKTQRVDVMYDKKVFTSYQYLSDTVLKKPVLFPIKTAQGTTITRGFPLETRPNERIDHPHHVGLWLNYENVNGYDYWNNSMAIMADDRKNKYGTIKHTGISSIKSGKVGELAVTADWIEQDGLGKPVLKEKTMYKFSGDDNQRIIDRITTLTATTETVTFKDVKDGMIAIRVARELEHPSKSADIFTDANGKATTVAKMDNTGVTGSYRSSEGTEGEGVWSTRAKWMNLRGKIGAEDVAVAIIDHPQNISYPTYWHARGYGLFAANPLGAKIFSNGKDTRNLSLKPGESVTFRYRVVVQSGKLTDADLNQLADDFGK